jgi:hypothetical protein
MPTRAAMRSGLAMAVSGPGADGAVEEIAAAGAVARVVEAQQADAVVGAEGREGGGLVAGHVGAEAGEEDDGGAGAGLADPGEFGAVVAIEAAGGLGAGGLGHRCDILKTAGPIRGRGLARKRRGNACDIFSRFAPTPVSWKACSGDFDTLYEAPSNLTAPLPSWPDAASGIPAVRAPAVEA